MESFNDIKLLWQTNETTNLPQLADIEVVMRQYNKKRKKKTLLAVILLVCILIILFLLITFVTIKMWTTYFGIIIWMGLAFYSIYLKFRRQSKSSNFEALANNDFLIALEKEENQTCIGKSKNQALLFIAWAVGFSFYIYEVSANNTNSLVIGYGSLVVYIIAIWFFYLPFMKKRNQKNIQKMITHIKQLKSQINE